VGTARLIRRLRDLDLPVDDVRSVLSAPDEESRNAVIVAHLDRMSRQLQETQETVDSLRRLLSGEERRLTITHRTEPGGPALAIRGLVDEETVVTWWMGAFTELHRFLRTSGTARAGSDGATFPTEFFTEGRAELLAFVPVTAPPEARAGLPGRVEVVDLPAQRYAMTEYDGPMVDLDGAYSALGRTVTERALATDGPVVERYLPNGAEDDLLDHRTQVYWPVREADSSTG
jgi:effector-binding domain-containing protein